MAQVNKSLTKVLFPKVKIEISDGTLIPEKGDKTLFSAWRISFYGAIALLVALPLFRPDPFKDIILFIPDGILVTFEVTVLAIVFAMLLGRLEIFTLLVVLTPAFWRK